MTYSVIFQLSLFIRSLSGPVHNSYINPFGDTQNFLGVPKVIRRRGFLDYSVSKGTEFIPMQPLQPRRVSQ